MPIIGAIIALVGSAVGAGVKADKARKDGLLLKDQLQAERDLMRENRTADIFNFLNMDNQKDAQILTTVLIMAVVLLALIFWFALKRKK